MNVKTSRFSKNTTKFSEKKYIEHRFLLKDTIFIYKSPVLSNDRSVSIEVLEGIIYVKDFRGVYKYTKGMKFSVEKITRSYIAFSDPAIGARVIYKISEACPLSIEGKAYLVETMEKLKDLDIETYNHSVRVRDLSFLLGIKLNLTATQLFALRVASYFHDIGKLYVNKEILTGNSKLTSNERELIEKHPEYGAKLLAKPLFLQKYSINDIINQHHENIDGSGYPNGLKGDDILIEAKIISIVDSFDAMTAVRPYQKRKTVNEAVKELETLAGTIYCKKVTEAFVSIITKGFDSPTESLF